MKYWRRINIFAAVLLIAGCLVILFLWTPPPDEPIQPKSDTERAQTTTGFSNDFDKVRAPSLLITGTVVDESDEGIPGVLVSFESGDGLRLQGQTEADGHFGVGTALDNSARAIELRVSAETIGYKPQTLTYNATPEKNNELKITMKPMPGTVSGVVIDDRGRPRGGYGVALRVPEIRDIRSNSFFRNRTLPAGETEPDGTFSLVDVPPGEYAFEVSALDGHRGDLCGANAPRVSVGLGENVVGVTLVIATLKVAGAVVDQDGLALKGVQVRVDHVTHGASYFADTTTDAEGLFELNDVPTALEMLQVKFQLKDYDAPSERVSLTNGVEDHLVVMTRIETFVKPIVATVLDGETGVTVVGAEVRPAGGEWQPTYGKPVELQLNWTSSRGDGYWSGFSARAEGYLQANSFLRDEDVAELATVPAYLFRDGRLDIAIELLPEFLAAARAANWNVTNRLQLFASTPGENAASHVRVTRQGESGFSIEAGPTQVVTCDVNILNVPIAPTGGEQSTYLTIDLSYARNSDEPKATVHIGGTKSLILSIPGLRRAELTRYEPTGIAEMTTGVQASARKEFHVSAARDDVCSFGFLSAGTYEVECSYVDPQGEGQTMTETVVIRPSDGELKLEWGL